MALKLILDSLDGLSDDLKKLYIPKDGKFVLDADMSGFESKADVEALRNALERQKTSGGELKEKLEQMVTRFKDVDPEKAREAILTLQEMGDKELIDAGKMDELLETRTERMRQEFTGQATRQQEIIDGNNTMITGLNSRLSEVLIDNAISVAAISNNVKEHAVMDVISRGRQAFTIGESGHPESKDAEGNVVFGADGKSPLAIDEWVNSLSQSASHLFDASSGGGAQTDQGGGNGGQEGQTGVVSVNDIGDNLEGIASGKIKVAPEG